jgi:c-di-GMP-binding flagellar brake protein YcgR
VPQENCWQGELVDLSAGGLQVSVSATHSPDFKCGQLLGLQFTPMSYQIPISVEGEVRHLAEAPQKSRTYIGVEFVGLEATREGREKLRRIVGTVDTYIEEGGAPVEEPSEEAHAVV